MDDATATASLRAGTRRWWAVGALGLALLVISLDMTVLNLALPTLATDLDASTSGLQWIVDSYLLVVAATMLPAGLLGDRFGRKRCLLGGLALFGVASAAAAYAGSAGTLIAARAVLGLAAAAMFTLALAVLPVLFTEKERPAAVTLLTAVVAVAYPLGPLVGGWLLTQFWWGSVFLVNVPVAAATLVAVGRLLPETRGHRRRHYDVTGALLSSIGLVGFTYGAIRAGERTWTDPRAMAAMAAGVAVLAAFVFWERLLGRRPDGQPLVDLRLFRSRSFTWGTILSAVVVFTIYGLLFAVPQYFQAVLGTDAMGAGTRLLPIVGGMIVGALVADRLTRLLGTKTTVALGFVLLAAGLVAGAGTTEHTAYATVAAWSTLAGVGLGFGLPTATDAALGTLATDHGVGSAVIQAVQRVGGTLGVAILGSVLNTVYRDGVDLTGLPAAADRARESASAGVEVAAQVRSPQLLASVRSAFVDGMDTLLLVCGIVAAASAVLAFVFLSRRPEPAAAAEPEPSTAPTPTPPLAGAGYEQP